MWKGGDAICTLTETMVSESIPVDALDQLNVTFVYINPDDYTVADMDGVSSIFYGRLADTKTRNPDLKVWISVGRWWAFNDEGQYPSLFTDIAAPTSKTKKFAKGLSDFMNQYGFDGVDLDWEYPGAPDRGGRKEDVDNYPTMLRKIKRFLQVHGGREFGLSITVLTSYWYLQ